MVYLTFFPRLNKGQFLRRNENCSSSFFAVSIFRDPVPDIDNFWKYIPFLLLFIQYRKSLAADPFKKKKKNNLEEIILEADCKK